MLAIPSALGIHYNTGLNSGRHFHATASDFGNRQSVWVGCGLVGGILALAQSRRAESEEKTAKYMESVRHQPELLLPFLQAMPKGGDLHVHLYGAIYAESMIDWRRRTLCAWIAALRS